MTRSYADAVTSPDARVPRLLPDAKPIPRDGVLLHIGVHKTGTTAIQAALADARTDLKAQGSRYPGLLKHHHRQALAAMERPWGWRKQGGSTYDAHYFQRIARIARMRRGRTVLSSEFFCEADTETARRIRDELGGDRVHVVVALRSLGGLLASSWQQYLKYGLTTPYEKWLREILKDTTPGKVSPTFWKRQDHAAVVGRWAEAVGASNLTVLIL
jgi:hypothetical protein